MKFIGIIIILLVLIGKIIFDNGVIIPKLNEQNKQLYTELNEQNKQLYIDITNTLTKCNDIKPLVYEELTLLNKICVENYILENTSDLKLETIKEITDNLIKFADEEKIPLAVLVGLAHTESNFNPKAISSSKARGILQVMYIYWADTFDIKSKKQLYEIDFNIMVGTKILSKHLKATDGNMNAALHKYYGINKKKNIYSSLVNSNIVKFIMFRDNYIHSIKKDIIKE